MLHLHSILRWAILILLIIAVFKSVLALMRGSEYKSGDSKTALILMTLVHLQLILGIVLYFTQGWATAPFAESMKEAGARFWKVEHLTAMLLAVTFITLGRSKSKKLVGTVKGHRTTLVFFGLSLLLVLWGIPWEAARMF